MPAVECPKVLWCLRTSSSAPLTQCTTAFSPLRLVGNQTNTGRGNSASGGVCVWRAGSSVDLRMSGGSGIRWISHSDGGFAVRFHHPTHSHPPRLIAMDDSRLFAALVCRWTARAEFFSFILFFFATGTTPSVVTGAAPSSASKRPTGGVGVYSCHHLRGRGLSVAFWHGCSTSAGVVEVRFVAFLKT